MIVDVGCGWGELLLRILAAAPRATGRGVDLDAEAIAEARRRATARGLEARVAFDAADARSALPASAQGAVCIGASQVWGPPVEACEPLDYRAALSALRARVARGSPVVYGEGIWSATPTPAAVAPLAGRRDEFAMLPDLLDMARECGFAIVQVHEATQDEWDAFESGFAARHARWLRAHPADHPQATEVRERARRQHDGYFRGYRGVLGMAYLALFAV
jgi:hypothetical protein